MRFTLAVVALGVAGCPPATSDECTQSTWFVDGDGDGFGGGDAITGCEDDRPANGVNLPADCNDSNPDINPSATEICNEVDDDCDGRTDDSDDDVDDPSAGVWYPDLDADGFGDEASAITACEQPDGTVEVAGDCDDEDELRFPDALEDCYSLEDMNCDGVEPTDDQDNDGAAACQDCDDTNTEVGIAPIWYRDRDMDGYGTTASAVQDCTAPPEHVLLGDDCNDAAFGVNPGADEVCDDVDNDCDGDKDDEDDDVVNAPKWFNDRDMDGFGDPAVFWEQCLAHPDTVSNSDDCDDTTADIGGPLLWYPDTDTDGYGDQAAASQSSCTAPFGKVSNNSDCDDGDALLNPDTIWYEDDDEDDFGDPDSTLTQCLQPTGYVSDKTDCDDTSHLVHPGRFDFDDDVDNDCDTSIDEDVGTESYSSTDIQNIIDSECSTCHNDTVSNGGLSLDSVFDDTVNQASSDVPSMDLHEPGDLRNSYIWHKLDGTQLDVGGAGAQMPSGGSLSSSDMDTWETWILEGAVE